MKPLLTEFYSSDDSVELALHHFLHLHQDGMLPQISRIYSNRVL